MRFGGGTVVIACGENVTVGTVLGSFVRREKSVYFG